MRRIWLDIETTGLDLETCSMLEVGIVLADVFDIVDQKNWLLSDSGFTCRDLRPRVVEMHTKNGLFDELRCSPDTKPREKVEQEMIVWVEERMPKGVPWKLAGSSIHFDRKFIDVQMPKFANRLHYRMLDVSAIKESLSDWAPALVDARPTPQALHRAVPDCIDSLGEWQYYKTVLLGDA